MSISVQRLLILVVAIVAVALVDGAARGLTMPPAAATELSTKTQELLAQARARQQVVPPTELIADQKSTSGEEPASAESPDDGKGMLTADFHLAWEAGIIQVVDARTSEQFQAGHIPGALSIPFEELGSGYPAALDVLSFDEPVVVYCDGGECNASRNVASLLIDMGFQDVTVFERGMHAWENAGYPIETDGGL
jgi:rhodanese-related sulfurtransferase